MAITTYRVSERGQMALPADARRRWDLLDGGSVEIADLGDSLLILPAGHGGLRALVSDAVTEAGGYAGLARAVASDEPDLD
jgi:bifunctional DNA-binding transcriptional regulator/antitoxin component of YhaV-PrlF toxin-antitoxin module